MKRIMFSFLIVILLLTFSACKEKTQIEKAQEKIVSIGQQFLDYELTVDEAREQLDSIVIPEIEGSGDLYLKADKNYLSFIILKTKNNGSSFEEIQEKIEYIKSRDYED